jgi:uncharacterized protein YndB with AHSA1/START domain
MTDYTTSVTIDRPPQDVFAAINDVRGWWGVDVQGSNARVGDEFTYRVQDIHRSRLRVVELVPGRRVAWLVLENRMNFVRDQTEWVGTTIIFDIVDRGGRTEVTFTHRGLTKRYECFDVCSDAWGSLLHHSLPSLVTTGTGHPYR